MPKILVSACLLGEAVRYDGQSKPLRWPELSVWQQAGQVVSCCPEVAGGLPVPRPPAECQPDGRILTVHGEEVTAAFVRGAQQALALCRQHDIRIALLKEASPSCGSGVVYDGRFVGQQIPGQGLTARLLREAGIAVYSEACWPQLLVAWAALCANQAAVEGTSTARDKNNG